MTTARHRAPPLWVRLNRPTRNRSQVLLAWAVVGILVPPVTALGQAIAPDARATVFPVVVALPSRAEEPTGRGGPIAPIFVDVDAPQYEPEPPHAPQSPASVNTGQGQRTAVQRSTAATTAAALPVPVAPTPTPAPVPPAPAVPEPVVVEEPPVTAEPTPTEETP